MSNIRIKGVEELSDLEKLCLTDFSYSRIDTYLSCPAKYFYSYIQKEPRTFSPPAVLGNIVHAALENCVDNEKPLDFRELKQEYLKQIPEWDPDQLIPRDLIDVGHVIIDEFYDQHSEKVFDVYAKEMAFRFIVGSYAINGFIDRVDVIDNKVVITDYKAQPLDSPVLTPDGWKRMGDIQVGDFVISIDGKPTEVYGVYPQGVVPAVKITFTDGASTVCSDSHLWEVRDLNNSVSVMTAKEILDSGLKKGGNYKYAIPTIEAVQFNEQNSLLIDPYVMGVILGDGGTTNGTIKLHCVDQQILDRVAESLPADLKLRNDGEHGHSISAHSRRNSYITALREYGLMKLRSHEKFIPGQYLRASIEDRYALLQGLMDTDGGSSTRTAFVTTSPFLRDGIVELIRSLGGLPMWSAHPSYYMKDGVRIDCKEKYIVNCRLDMNPFFLQRKRDQFKERKIDDSRRIKSIERVDDIEMQCIKVMHPRGLYVTNDYIVTHNTGRWEVSAKEAPNNLQLGIYALAASLEFPDHEIYAELYYLRSGRKKGHLFTRDDLDRVKERIVEIANKIVHEQNFRPTDQYRTCSYCDHAKSGACGIGAYRNNRKK